MKLQMTLFATNKKYRPISTIIEIENMEEYKQNKAKYQKKAIENICHNRKTTWKDLKEQSYTTVKVREYNLEKISKRQKIELFKQLYENYKKRLDKE